MHLINYALITWLYRTQKKRKTRNVSHSVLSTRVQSPSRFVVNKKSIQLDSELLLKLFQQIHQASHTKQKNLQYHVRFFFFVYSLLLLHRVSFARRQ